MYAIVEISGKQYKVSEGDIVFVDRQEVEEGTKLTFDKVLLVSDDKKVTVGENFVKDAKVEAVVIGNGKFKKVLVYKYKAKKNERNMKGHRQPYTKIQIENIVYGTKTEKLAESKKVEAKNEAKVAPKKVATKKATKVVKESAEVKAETKKAVKKATTKKAEEVKA